MSGWVSVKPGRKPKPATDPAPPAPPVAVTTPADPTPAPRAPQRCCDNPAHVPGRPQRPKPEPVQCSGCHGTGRTLDSGWTSTFNTPGLVSTGPVVDAEQLFTPGTPREVPCWSCRGVGWVLPSPQPLPPVFPGPAVPRPGPHQWWHPAPTGPTITC